MGMQLVFPQIPFKKKIEFPPELHCDTALFAVTLSRVLALILLQNMVQKNKIKEC